MQYPEATKPAYALEGLKTRGFQFVRSPDSPIVDVRVKRLGFGVIGNVSCEGGRTDYLGMAHLKEAGAFGIFEVVRRDANRP